MTDLWSHQKRLLELTEHKNEFALFWHPGVGKTRGVIEVLNRKMEKEQRFLKTLVLCPLSVVSVWQNELLANGYNLDQIVIGDGSGNKRKQKIYNSLYDSGHKSLTAKKILVLNYDAIILPGILDMVTKWNPEFLICDESHKLKSHSATRSKVVCGLARLAKYKFLLSGTPVLKDIGDLFMQMKVLNPTILGENFYAFQRVYFWDKNSSWRSSPNHFPDWQPRPESVDKISEKIKPVSMSVKKEECLDLPPLVSQTIMVPMSRDQERAYNEMKAEMVSFLDKEKDHVAVATIALTKALRHMQIISGFVSMENGENHVFDDNPRLKVLSDLLDDIVLSSKVIVWSCFRQNYQMIRDVCGKLKIPYVELTGETSGKDRANNIRRFQEDEDCRVLIGNQNSGGIGVNLTAASHMIYYSKNFSLEAQIQSEARNYRHGSEVHQKITRIDLCAQGTIDEVLNRALANKQDVGEAILTELKRW